MILDGVSTSDTHDPRVRVGRLDARTWRLWARDDVSGWAPTGPPFPTRTVALARVDHVVSYYYGEG